MRLNRAHFYTAAFFVLLFGFDLIYENQSGNATAVTTIENAKLKENAKSKDDTITKPLYHQQIIANLKMDGGVIPTEPEVHPVTAMYNREAIIPPQCYTRTEGKFNPCYVCHQDHIPERENTMNDADIQSAYSFSDLGLTNQWKNLFTDRSEAVSQISDAEILQWIDEDNYSELAGRLKAANFEGWIPDLKNLELGAGAFDTEGFALDGSQWVAFNYKPMPSTFWPTNGSTDDVMIRLAEPFRQNKEGKYSKEVYKANLAITEAKIKGIDKITSLPIDEKQVGKDLNGDNQLSVVTEITQVEKYVGNAKNAYIDTHLYPKGTEFLHTVRYVGIDEEGNLYNPKRMKEVRYMKKWRIFAKPTLARVYQLEGFEKEAGHLPGFHNLHHNGLDNGSAWSIQGFIEDNYGRLRFNTYEENFFCMGCHSSIGSTIDKTFSFARKIDGAEGWGYINLKGMPDAPNKGEKKGEILTYLTRVGGGGEFRSNPEMQNRWFNADGSVNTEKVSNAKDVHDLITPSHRRALELNKAYRVIVAEQSFIFGRDATVTPPINVYDAVDNETSPTLSDDLVYEWDIRLDWAQK